MKMLHRSFIVRIKDDPVVKAVLHEYNAWIFTQRQYDSQYEKIFKEDLKRKFIEEELSYYSLTTLKLMQGLYEHSSCIFTDSDSNSSAKSESYGGSVSVGSDFPENFSDSSDNEIF